MKSAAEIRVRPVNICGVYIPRVIGLSPRNKFTLIAFAPFKWNRKNPKGKPYSTYVYSHKNGLYKLINAFNGDVLEVVDPLEETSKAS